MKKDKIEEEIIVTPNNDSEEGLSLRDLIIIVKKNIVLLLICTIIGLTSAFIYAKVGVTPQYSSTSRLYVVSSDSVINISDLQLGASLTSDYMELIKSKPFITEAAKKIDIEEEYTYAYLNSRVNVVNPTDSHILRIVVTTPDPKLSADFANALADVTVKEIEDIMEKAKPKVIEYGEPSYVQVNANKLVYSLIGAMIGIIVAACIILIKEAMNNKIKNEEDVYKYLALDTLGVIYDNQEAKEIKRKKER